MSHSAFRRMKKGAIIMNASQLAMRDPALAALVGAVSDDFGAEFGDDYGDEYGADFGQAPAIPAAAPGYSPLAAVPRGTPQQMQALWHAHHANALRSQSRRRLMDPNEGLSTKIERYTFSLNATITSLGTAQANLNASSQPDVRFRPEQFTVNVPSIGMVLISDIRMANVSVTVGGGNLEDAFDYSPLSVGRQLSMPTLEPSNKATVTASYTGFVPSPLTGTGAFTIVYNFKGWARLAG
jgi:hypothetical protein